MVNEQIQSIQQKVQELWLHAQKLTKENKQLQQELQEAITAKKALLKKIEQLEQSKAAFQIGVDTWSDADKQELASKVNGYIKEIEHWLAVLKSA
jgi:chromosome segregation ATPase